MDILTRLEEAILVAIVKLADDAYGVTINGEVSRIFNKKYSMGALYFSLDRLYEKGFVVKESGEPTPKRGGRSKTYYSLTREGREALSAVREHQKSLWLGLTDFEAE